MCDSHRESRRRAASRTQRRDSKRLQEAEVAATESGLAAAAWEAVCTLCAAPAESIVSSSTSGKNPQCVVREKKKNESPALIHLMTGKQPLHHSVCHFTGRWFEL